MNQIASFRIVVVLAFLLAACPWLFAQEQGFKLTLLEYEGLERLPSWYVANYNTLELGKSYSKDELERKLLDTKVRLESDQSILFADTDVLYYPEENSVEVYILVTDNTLLLTPGGGEIYAKSSWYNTLAAGSVISAYLGYNLQALGLDFPYLASLPIGLELFGGHEIKNKFDFKGDIYSDLFGYNYFYWHPLPELRLGAFQQVDAVAYYNRSTGFLPRWQIGTKLQLNLKALAKSYGLGFNFLALSAWRPVGEYQNELNQQVEFTLYGDFFNWFTPYMQVLFDWHSPNGERLLSEVYGSKERGEVRNSVEFRLIAQPWQLRDPVPLDMDLGVSFGVISGFVAPSWQDIKLQQQMESSFYAGPYLSLYSPINIAMMFDFGIRLFDNWQQSSFVFHWAIVSLYSVTG